MSRFTVELKPDYSDAFVRFEIEASDEAAAQNFADAVTVNMLDQDTQVDFGNECGLQYHQSEWRGYVYPADEAQKSE